ncbi:MAG: hypothetical protein GY778_12540, partial [bacterium]|nr:hypothetical protein [bacterium]
MSRLNPTHRLGMSAIVGAALAGWILTGLGTDTRAQHAAATGAAEFVNAPDDGRSRADCNSNGLPDEC